MAHNQAGQQPAAARLPPVPTVPNEDQLVPELKLILEAMIGEEEPSPEYVAFHDDNLSVLPALLYKVFTGATIAALRAKAVDKLYHLRETWSSLGPGSGLDEIGAHLLEAIKEETDLTVLPKLALYIGDYQTTRDTPWAQLQDFVDDCAFASSDDAAEDERKHRIALLILARIMFPVSQPVYLFIDSHVTAPNSPLHKESLLAFVRFLTMSNQVANLSTCTARILVTATGEGGRRDQYGNVYGKREAILCLLQIARLYPTYLVPQRETVIFICNQMIENDDSIACARAGEIIEKMNAFARIPTFSNRAIITSALTRLTAETELDIQHPQRGDEFCMIVVIRYMAKISEFDPEAVQYAAEFARVGNWAARQSAMIALTRVQLTRAADRAVTTLGVSYLGDPHPYVANAASYLLRYMIDFGRAIEVDHCERVMSILSGSRAARVPHVAEDVAALLRSVTTTLFERGHYVLLARYYDHLMPLLKLIIRAAIRERSDVSKVARRCALYSVAVFGRVAGLARFGPDFHEIFANYVAGNEPFELVADRVGDKCLVCNLVEANVTIKRGDERREGHQDTCVECECTVARWCLSCRAEDYLQNTLNVFDERHCTVCKKFFCLDDVRHVIKKAKSTEVTEENA